MDSYSLPRLVSVERLDGGAVIAFADGRVAYYSAFLLHAVIDQAELIEHDESKEEL